MFYSYISLIVRIFSREAACEVIEAEKYSHVFYEAEPDIWIVLVCTFVSVPNVPSCIHMKRLLKDSK
jgi:hypothetical protein